MRADLAALDSIPIGAFAVSRGYEILFWNLCMEGWTDIGRGEAMGRDLRDLFPGFRNPAIESRLQTVFDGGPPAVFSYQLHGDLLPKRRPALVPRFRQCTASPLAAAGDALFTVEDRTDIAAKSREVRSELARREAVERDLRATVAEREMLMRELNHRVKNSFNMVLSLIDLELSSLPEGEARKRLVDLEARVNSIAALHGSLYRAKEGVEVALDEYLAALAQRLFSAFTGKPGGPDLELVLERVVMSRDEAIYLGLAVNELLTNAIKYGEGRVTLGLVREKGGGISVTVRDEGPGFTTPIPMRQDAMGLRLVEMLAAQVGGVFEMDGSGGGFFALRLPPAQV